MSTPTVAKPTRAIVTCMDYRVKESVILQNMGWDGAYVIRNAGGVVTQDVIRSLLMLQKFVLHEQYDIEILVVAHTECGMISPGEDELRWQIENDFWICETPPFALETFPSAELGVRRSVQRLRTSRFVNSRTAAGLKIWGQLYDVKTHTLSGITTYAFQPRESWAQVAAKHQNYIPTPTVESLIAANPQTEGAPYQGVGQVVYVPGQPK